VLPQLRTPSTVSLFAEHPPHDAPQQDPRNRQKKKRDDNRAKYMSRLVAEQLLWKNDARYKQSECAQAPEQTRGAARYAPRIKLFHCASCSLRLYTQKAAQCNAGRSGDGHRPPNIGSFHL